MKAARWQQRAVFCFALRRELNDGGGLTKYCEDVPLVEQAAMCSIEAQMRSQQA
jgi:hypothetical protein